MPKKKAGKDKSDKKLQKHKSHKKGNIDGLTKKDHKKSAGGKHHKKDGSAKNRTKDVSKKDHKSTGSKKASKDSTKHGKPDDSSSCAEHGVWTDVTQVKHPPAHPQPLDFSSIDPDENQRILSSGKMSFAMVGCSGDPKSPTNTKAVAAAIAADQDLSFFYHLGDIIYTVSGSDANGDSVKPYSHSLWDIQFFGPHAKFPHKIFSIAGNHDGKYKEKIEALGDYFKFFCADDMEPPKGTKTRRKMTQPYIYWSLNTPYAYIIGLYSNIANGGILDKPKQYTTANFTEGPQYKWLVGELKAAAAMNKNPNAQKKAVLLAVHYPPYSGATNFVVRGDQSKGGLAAKGKRPAQPNNYDAPYLAVALQQAFKDGGQRPDAIFSAHAHLFQRLTYNFADGTVMPCLVAGAGGHSPLEQLFKSCSGTLQAATSMPAPAVKPGSFQFPKGDSAQVVYFDDKDSGGSFGYLKVTIDAKAHTLTCQFMGVKDGGPVSLDRQTITIRPAAIAGAHAGG
jgi:acid phosphatase type 7